MILNVCKNGNIQFQMHMDVHYAGQNYTWLDITRDEQEIQILTSNFIHVIWNLIIVTVKKKPRIFGMENTWQKKI